MSLERTLPFPPLQLRDHITYNQTGDQLKIDALVLTTALSILAIVGGVLGLIALGGTDLGALNALCGAVTEPGLYATIIAGVCVCALTSSLLATFCNTLNKRQLSGEQVNRLAGLKQWLRDERVFETLRFGQYILFPYEFERRPSPVFGIVFKERSGEHKLYVFKTGSARNYKLYEMVMHEGYTDYESFFSLDEVPFSERWRTERVEKGYFRRFDFLSRNGKPGFGLQLSNRTYFLKTEDARLRFQKGLVDQIFLDRERQNGAPSTPQNDLYILPPSIFGELQKKKEDSQRTLDYLPPPPVKEDENGAGPP